jgi:predicted 3-demethylubiquinone-9 3-methyltransferase (glyoxalase superfamily)
MKKIQPFIWFKESGEEAMALYTSLFPNSKVVQITQLPQAPGPVGQFVGVFELMGETFMCLQGGENPMTNGVGPISLVAQCDTQEEIDKLWDAFKEGGKEIACGWISDRYGVTWQVVPSQLGEWMSDPDSEKAKRTAIAMMDMMKFDIAALKRAHEGE